MCTVWGKNFPIGSGKKEDIQEQKLIIPFNQYSQCHGTMLHPRSVKQTPSCLDTLTVALGNDDEHLAHLLGVTLNQFNRITDLIKKPYEVEILKSTTQPMIC